MVLSNTKEKSIVQKICSLARLQNEETLTKLIKSGVCIDVLEKGGEYNAVMLLAKEGNKQAVDFLIDNFKSNRNAAVRGYARGGHVNLVKEQLAAGASPDFAVWGYAASGNIAQVNALLEKKASVNHAVLGYASSGFIDQVNLLLANGGSIGYAAKGYAYGGYDDQVKKMLDAGLTPGWAVCGYACAGRFDQVNALTEGKKCLEDAASGYAYGGYDQQVDELLTRNVWPGAAIVSYALAGRNAQVKKLDPQGHHRQALTGYAESGNFDQINQYIAAHGDKEAVLIAYHKAGFLNNLEEAIRIASLTDHPVLRKRLLALASQKNPGCDDAELNERATKLNRIMKEYQLTYKQAQALEIKGARLWMLQGQSLVKDEKFPPELFLAIAASVSKLPGRDTLKVFSAVNRNLLFGAMDITAEEYKNNKLTIGQSVRRQKQIDKNCHRRMNFGF